MSVQPVTGITTPTPDQHHAAGLYAASAAVTGGWQADLPTVLQMLGLATSPEPIHRDRPSKRRRSERKP